MSCYPWKKSKNMKFESQNCESKWICPVSQNVWHVQVMELLKMLKVTWMKMKSRQWTLFCKSLKYINSTSDNELLRCAQSSKKPWMFTYNSHWRLFCFLPFSTCPVVFCFYTIVEAPCFVIILFHFFRCFILLKQNIYLFSQAVFVFTPQKTCSPVSNSIKEKCNFSLQVYQTDLLFLKP